MNKDEILKQLEHYDFMIETMTLNERHLYWITCQQIELKESLAQFQD
jgi:hypothetical protein